MAPLISIGICTYRRPTLDRALSSLEQLELPEAMRLQIIVVDNDEAGSAREIAERYIGRGRHEVCYQIEPRKGLSSARNRVLSLAKGAWVAFIDDDERAEPNWIAELYSVANGRRADAAIGSVIPEFAVEPPNWVVTSRFFEAPLPSTGNAVTVSDALSGNVLLRTEFVSTHGLKFDEAFNTTGGEDSDFFHRFLDSGGTIVSAREAAVHELVPRERMTAHYMLRRSLRVGESYARMRHCHGGTPMFIGGVLRATMNVAASALLTVVSLPFGSDYYYRFYLLLARNAGKFRYYFGLSPIEMYK